MSVSGKSLNTEAAPSLVTGSEYCHPYLMKWACPMNPFLALIHVKETYTHCIQEARGNWASGG